MAELHFFNPYADIRFTVNRLPHWQQEGAVYFVTFRLADAVPHNLRTQWESDVKHGCVYTRNLGVPKWSANIMNGSLAQSNAGLMSAMVLAFCGGTIAPKS